LPGIVATFALLLINLVSRDDLAEISSTGDPGDNVSWENEPCMSLMLQLISIQQQRRRAVSLSHPLFFFTYNFMQTRARAWLLFSFLLALSSVGGSISVLISTSQAQQFTATGVVSIVFSLFFFFPGCR
jgi:hypothetical protein